MIKKVICVLYEYSGMGSSSPPHFDYKLMSVAVFVMCWSPYIVFDLLQVYGYIPRTQNNIAVATLIQSLAPLNSAANPIIYCMFSASKATR